MQGSVSQQKCGVVCSGGAAGQRGCMDIHRNGAEQRWSGLGGPAQAGLQGKGAAIVHQAMQSRDGQDRPVSPCSIKAAGQGESTVVHNSNTEQVGSGQAWQPLLVQAAGAREGQGKSRRQLTHAPLLSCTCSLCVTAGTTDAMQAAGWRGTEAGRHCANKCETAVATDH